MNPDARAISLFVYYLQLIKMIQDNKDHFHNLNPCMFVSVCSGGSDLINVCESVHACGECGT